MSTKRTPKVELRALKLFDEAIREFANRPFSMKEAMTLPSAKGQTEKVDAAIGWLAHNCRLEWTDNFKLQIYEDEVEAATGSTIPFEYAKNRRERKVRRDLNLLMKYVKDHTDRSAYPGVLENLLRLAIGDNGDALLRLVNKVKDND